MFFVRADVVCSICFEYESMIASCNMMRGSSQGFVKLHEHLSLKPRSKHCLEELCVAIVLSTGYLVQWKP